MSFSTTRRCISLTISYYLLARGGGKEEGGKERMIRGLRQTFPFLFFTFPRARDEEEEGKVNREAFQRDTHKEEGKGTPLRSSTRPDQKIEKMNDECWVPSSRQWKGRETIG